MYDSDIGPHVEKKRQGVDGSIRGGVHDVDLTSGVHRIAHGTHLPLHGCGAVAENAVAIH